MSRFLGPIHLWLHNKIVLQEELELAVLKALEENNYDISKTISIDNQYGLPNPNEQLESAIDSQNIHGWLSNRIANAETRFASKLTQLEKEHGPVVIEIAGRVFEDYGASIGKALSESGRYDGSLQTAHKLLHDYVLEGMPCDRAGGITEQSDQLLKWQTVRCLHESYWQLVGGNVSHHYTLRNRFSKNFFTALSQLNYHHEISEGIHLYTLQQ